MPEVSIPTAAEAKLSPQERKNRLLKEMVTGFDDFQGRYPEGIKPDPHFAAFRCIDCRSPTAQVLGFPLGSVYVTSSVAGIVPRPSSDPDGQTQSFFNVVHGALGANGLIVMMAHTDCQGVKKMVEGADDKWLNEHSKKLYKDVRARHPDIDISDRGTPLEPDFKAWLCREIEMEIVRNDVERAHKYLDKASHGEPTSPIVGVLLWLGTILPSPSF